MPLCEEGFCGSARRAHVKYLRRNMTSIIITPSLSHSQARYPFCFLFFLSLSLLLSIPLVSNEPLLCLLSLTAFYLASGSKIANKTYCRIALSMPYAPYLRVNVTLHGKYVYCNAIPKHIHTHSLSMGISTFIMYQLPFAFISFRKLATYHRCEWFCQLPDARCCVRVCFCVYVVRSTINFEMNVNINSIWVYVYALGVV